MNAAADVRPSTPILARCQGALDNWGKRRVSLAPAFSTIDTAAVKERKIGLPVTVSKGKARKEEKARIYTGQGNLSRVY